MLCVDEWCAPVVCNSIFLIRFAQYWSGYQIISRGALQVMCGDKGK